MNLLLSSFARAAAQCLQRTVLLWTLFPLLLMAVLGAVLGWLFWDRALHQTSDMLQRIGWLSALWQWLQQQGLGWSVDVLAGLLVVLAVTPLLVVLVLMLVSLVMTPRLVEWVARRRFPALERKRGGAWWQGLVWAIRSTALAVLVLLLSVPLWFVPPLILLIPPLVWGWLTYRVMAFDALAEHASASERAELLSRYRMQWLLMGVVCGLLGAAPSLVWASGVVFVAFVWLLVPVAVWIYALVLAFSSLWFAHFGLEALERLRQERGELQSPAPTAPLA